MSREDLRPLTALRFPAAALVFLWHTPATNVMAYVFSFGYAGVGFFFVLSGFILTYTYQRAFDGTLSAPAVSGFYVARFARIYPVLAATTLMMLAVLCAIGGPYWSAETSLTRILAVPAQLLLIQSWIPNPGIFFGVNGPAWSLGVEGFFYALFPFIAYAAFRMFRGASAWRVAFVAALVWVALLLVEVPLRAEHDDWRLYIFPPARLPDFVVGVLLAIAFVRRGAQLRLPLRATSLEALALAAAGLLVYVSPFVPISLRFSAWLMPAWCALIFVFALQRGAFSRMLSHPAAVRLGEMSYSFYLCHFAVITVFIHLLGRLHPALPGLAFATSLSLSYLLYHGLERPLRCRIRASFAQRAPGRPENSADPPRAIVAGMAAP